MTRPAHFYASQFEDWCHFCGHRSMFQVGVWYADNAENDPSDADRGNYVRICRECAYAIGEASLKRQADDASTPHHEGETQWLI